MPATPITAAAAMVPGPSSPSELRVLFHLLQVERQRVDKEHEREAQGGDDAQHGRVEAEVQKLQPEGPQHRPEEENTATWGKLLRSTNPERSVEIMMTTPIRASIETSDSVVIAPTVESNT